MGRPRQTALSAAIGAVGKAALAGSAGGVVGALIGASLGPPTLEDALRAFMSEHELELVSVRSRLKNEISITFKVPDGSYSSIVVRVPSPGTDVDDELYDQAVKQLSQVSRAYAPRTSP